MKFDDRVFIKTLKECDIPDLDEHDAKLFKGLTQERVDMLAQIKHEGDQRIKRDEELHDEMHSFGMIECKATDKAAKFFTIETTAEDSANMWCYFLKLDLSSAITQGNWGVKLPAGLRLTFWISSEQPSLEQRYAFAFYDKYKIRCDIDADGTCTFYIGTSGFMTNGTELVTTLSMTNNKITLHGEPVFYK